MSIAPGDLTSIPFFRDLDAPLARRCAAAATAIVAEQGQLILDFEDSSDDVFFVLTGAVRVVVRTAGGREVILGDIAAGEFFGEMAAIDGAARSASITALNRARLCRMPGRAFMDIVVEAPLLGRRLLQVLARRIRELNLRLLELTSLDVRHRLYAALLREARPGQRDSELVISPPPVQQILANRIGARREAVSREMARLLREGTLARRRAALVIVRPEELRQALAEATAE